jgi:hypothetical protein
VPQFARSERKSPVPALTSGNAQKSLVSLLHQRTSEENDGVTDTVFLSSSLMSWVELF